MQRFIAFLRAINVGGRVVKMERLRLLFESLGLKRVETFIASGNVIFESRGSAGLLEKKIEPLLQKELGYEVRTFIRSADELAEIAVYNPFGGAGELPHEALFIGFLAESPSQEAVATLVNASSETDQFHIKRRELYWLRRGESNESRFSGGKLEKMLGMATTLRNANTVRRIAANYPPRATRSGRVAAASEHVATPPTAQRAVPTRLPRRRRRSASRSEWRSPGAPL